MKRSITSVAALFVLAVTSAARADLAFWHVTPGAGPFSGASTTANVANWTPDGGANLNNAGAATTGVSSGIAYTIWDNAGPHGLPGSYGGQLFDLKAMYATRDATDLHVGLVTGFNPAGVNEYNTDYHLGDLAINPDFGNNTAAFGLKTIAAAVGSSGSNEQLIAGGTWTTPNVSTGFPGAPYSNLTSGGTLVASDGGYSYTSLGISYFDPTTGQNVPINLLEFDIKLSDLGLSDSAPITLSLAPTCENDTLTVTLPGDITNVGGGVPEPASVSLLGVAAAGLLMRRKR